MPVIRIKEVDFSGAVGSRYFADPPNQHVAKGGRIRWRNETTLTALIFWPHGNFFVDEPGPFTLELAVGETSDEFRVRADIIGTAKKLYFGAVGKKEIEGNSAPSIEVP